MDKLTDLLKKMGASEELVNEFTTSLEQHEKELRESIQGEFQGAYEACEDKAKKICVEEVEKEKVRLARKVQVYLESKQREFEEAAQRQRAIEESEATQALRRIKALVEGNDPNAAGGESRDLQASRELNARLEKVLASLKEERDRAVQSAARARKIAEDVLSRNKALEAARTQPAVAEAKKGPPSKEEPKAKDGKEGKPKWEKPWEKKSKDKDPAEGKTAAEPKRIDESRKVAAQPQSTRTVVTESRTTERAGDIATIAAALVD
jgi:hypothetical protein